MSSAPGSGQAFGDEQPATLLDRLIGWISPAQGLRRHHARRMLQRAYLAAAAGDPWKPKRPGASANTDHAIDASKLVAKSRFLIQNVDYIAAGMRARVAHIVGTGIVRKWQGRSGKRLQALHKAWGKRCDADGRLSLEALEAAAVRAMDSDGECLIRRRDRRPEDGLPVPLQVQLLEIDWLDTARQTPESGGNQVINGIEYDALGRVVAYYLWDQHPGDLKSLRSRGLVSRRIDAANIIHLYAPERPGAGRGFPRLAPVITRARDLQLLEDAELARKNQESRLGIVASGDLSQLQNPPDNLFGDATKTGSLGELPSGGILQVPPGMNITTLEPQVAPGFVAYCNYNVHMVCAGGGFTYEQATGDMSQVNFSSARMRMLDFRREVEQLQWHTVIPTLCERIDAWFFDAAVRANLVAAQQYTVEYSTPKWDTVDPAKEVKADLEEIAGGLVSFSEKMRRRGYEPEAVVQELAEDIKRFKDAGIWDDLVQLQGGGRRNAGDGNSQPASTGTNTDPAASGA